MSFPTPTPVLLAVEKKMLLRQQQRERERQRHEEPGVRRSRPEVSRHSAAAVPRKRGLSLDADRARSFSISERRSGGRSRKAAALSSSLERERAEDRDRADVSQESCGLSHARSSLPTWDQEEKAGEGERALKNLSRKRARLEAQREQEDEGEEPHFVRRERARRKDAREDRDREVRLLRHADEEVGHRTRKKGVSRTDASPGSSRAGSSPEKERKHDRRARRNRSGRGERDTPRLFVKGHSSPIVISEATRSPRRVLGAPEVSSVSLPSGAPVVLVAASPRRGSLFPVSSVLGKKSRSKKPSVLGSSLPSLADDIDTDSTVETHLLRVKGDADAPAFAPLRAASHRRARSSSLHAHRRQREERARRGRSGGDRSERRRDVSEEDRVERSRRRPRREWKPEDEDSVAGDRDKSAPIAHASKRGGKRGASETEEVRDSRTDSRGNSGLDSDAENDRLSANSSLQVRLTGGRRRQARNKPREPGDSADDSPAPRDTGRGPGPELESENRTLRGTRKALLEKVAGQARDLRGRAGRDVREERGRHIRDATPPGLPDLASPRLRTVSSSRETNLGTTFPSRFSSCVDPEGTEKTNTRTQTAGRPPASRTDSGASAGLPELRARRHSLGDKRKDATDQREGEVCLVQPFQPSPAGRDSRRLADMRSTTTDARSLVSSSLVSRHLSPDENETHRSLHPLHCSSSDLSSSHLSSHLSSSHLSSSHLSSSHLSSSHLASSACMHEGLGTGETGPSALGGGDGQSRVVRPSPFACSGSNALTLHTPWTPDSGQVLREQRNLEPKKGVEDARARGQVADEAETLREKEQSLRADLAARAPADPSAFAFFWLQEHPSTGEKVGGRQRVLAPPEDNTVPGENSERRVSADGGVCAPPSASEASEPTSSVAVAGKTMPWKKQRSCFSAASGSASGRWRDPKMASSPLPREGGETFLRSPDGEGEKRAPGSSASPFCATDRNLPGVKKTRAGGETTPLLLSVVSVGGSTTDRTESSASSLAGQFKPTFAPREAEKPRKGDIGAPRGAELWSWTGDRSFADSTGQSAPIRQPIEAAQRWLAREANACREEMNRCAFETRNNGETGDNGDSGRRHTDGQAARLEASAQSQEGNTERLFGARSRDRETQDRRGSREEQYAGANAVRFPHQAEEGDMLVQDPLPMLVTPTFPSQLSPCSPSAFPPSLPPFEFHGNSLPLGYPSYRHEEFARQEVESRRGALNLSAVLEAVHTGASTFSLHLAPLSLEAQREMAARAMEEQEACKRDRPPPPEDSVEKVKREAEAGVDDFLAFLAEPFPGCSEASRVCTPAFLESLSACPAPPDSSLIRLCRDCGAGALGPEAEAKEGADEAGVEAPQRPQSGESEKTELHAKDLPVMKHVFEPMLQAVEAATTKRDLQRLISVFPPTAQSSPAHQDVLLCFAEKVTRAGLRDTRRCLEHFAVYVHRKAETLLAARRAQEAARRAEESACLEEERQATSYGRLWGSIRAVLAHKTRELAQARSLLSPLGLDLRDYRFRENVQLRLAALPQDKEEKNPADNAAADPPNCQEKEKRQEGEEGKDISGEARTPEALREELLACDKEAQRIKEEEEQQVALLKRRRLRKLRVELHEAINEGKQMLEALQAQREQVLVLAQRLHGAVLPHVDEKKLLLQLQRRRSQRWGTPERGAPSRGSGDLPGNISSGRQGAEGSSQSPPAPGRGSLLESPRLHRLLPSLFDLSLPPSRRFSLASLLGERSVLGEDENTEETRRAEESDKADCGEEDEGDRAGGRERVGDARQGDERRQGERREEVGASGSKFSSDKLNFCLSRGDGREERDGAFLSSSSNGRSLRLSDLDGGGDEELKPTQKLGLPDTTTSADPRESAASPAKAPPVEKRSLSCSFETSKSVSSRSHLAFSQALPSGQAGEGERKERGAKVGDGSLHFFDQEREGTAAVSAEKLVLQWREVNAANCKQQKRTAQASLARVETLRETARRARAEFLLHAEETPGSLSRLWGETNEATSFSETRDERRRENDQTAEGRDAREKRQEVLERILNAASLSEAPQRRQRPREDERGTDRDNPGRGEETPGLFDRLRLRPQTHPSREEETFSLRNLASTRRR
ncbi:hypothetical protein TGRUB_265770 [Toxoplasma gondii RUB]|uniref:Uncharacterized protein n=1 Tax=Toxoplasma gondii RUB TaxID=935652 RepID=A0A086LJW9_TOXGO|nr:hypothetical protein TGRUB_265770 [Toxoplasma gondii RUB]